ncbi:unnamed protein product [Musa banksii]
MKNVKLEGFCVVPAETYPHAYPPRRPSRHRYLAVYKYAPHLPFPPSQARMIRRMSRVADCSQCPAMRGWEKGRRPAAAAAQGHVPLHVGEEMERFEVRTELLARPAFLELLRRSAQEYGYGQRGVLRIPCPVPFFRRLLEACGSRVEEEGLLRSFDELFHSSSDPN